MPVCPVVCEALERRRLLSFSSFPIPVTDTGGFYDYGGDIAAGPGKTIWVTDSFGARIIRVSPNGAMSQFHLPNGYEHMPTSIVEGHDGNMWFADQGQVDKIGRITPSGQITEFSIPHKLTPLSLVAGPDHNVWFTANQPANDGLGYYLNEESTLARITRGGRVREFSLQNSALGPIRLGSGLAVGADKNFYVSADTNVAAGIQGGSYVMKVNSAGKVVATFGAAVGNLVAGPDGTVWGAGYGGITKLAVSGQQTLVSYPRGVDPTSILVGPGGNPWFIDSSGDVGFLRPDGTAAVAQTPDAGKIAAIILGGDGNLWMIDQALSHVYRLTLQNTLLARGQSSAVMPAATQTFTVASFTDLAPSANQSAMVAQINWGDGTTSAGTIQPDGKGGYLVTGDHSFGTPADGTAETVTVTIRDLQTAQSATATATLTFKYPTPQGTGIDIAAASGELFQGNVGDMTNVDLYALSSYNVAISWGDGFYTPGTLVPDGKGGAFITGSYRYPHSGSYDILTTVLNPPDIYGQYHYLGAATFSKATISSGVMEAHGYTALALTGQAFNNVVATFMPMHFTPADLSHYHATFTWRQPGTADPSPTNLNATLSTNDQGGFNAAVSFLINPSGSSAISDGGFEYEVTVSDDRLGTGNAAVVGMARGLVLLNYKDILFVPSPVSVIWPAEYPRLSQELAQAQAEAVLVDHPLLTENPTPSGLQLHAQAGQQFAGEVGTVAGVVSDVITPQGQPTPVDPATLNGTILWGDGSTSAATFTVDESGAVHVSGTHTYSAAGSYAIRVLVTQDITPSNTWSFAPVILAEIRSAMVVS